MNVSIFGLGYVGTVCAACFAELGHRVVGVDKAPLKVNLIRNGKSPVVEPGLDEKVQRAVASGGLTATLDAAEAVLSTEVSMISVGTPSSGNGELDLSAVRQVAVDIGSGLKRKTAPHTVVVRSTVLPGTTAQVIVPLIEQASGKQAGKDFAVAFNPEFLREGCAIADFDNPAKTVVGAADPDVARVVHNLYGSLPGPKISVSIETAELAKYVDNSWHALKVAFANEVGAISKSFGLDSRSVMDIFAQDQRLNISSAYLRPGFAFGGSCLPKDLKALTYIARAKGISLPLVESVLPSNQMTQQRGLNWVLSFPGQRIAFFGITFKAGTDDVRESPYVDLAKGLIDAGRLIRIFDPNVKLSQMVGANKEFLLRAPKFIELLQDDAAGTVEWADIVILTSSAPAYLDALSAIRSTQVVLQLSDMKLPSDIQIKARGLQW